MAKPVDKARQIRYNFYGILIYWTYLIIPRMAGSSESAFLFLDTKNRAVAPVVIVHLLLQQPPGIISIFGFFTLIIKSI